MKEAYKHNSISIRQPDCCIFTSMEVHSRLRVEFQGHDWEHFANGVRGSFRHIISPSIFSDVFELDQSQRFLMALHDSSRYRLRKIEKGTVLWRAQLGGNWKPLKIKVPEFLGGGQESRVVLVPHNRKRMIPFPDQAAEGRVNPKGIPCLYVATDPRTAMSEVKPALGSYVTVAEFQTTRDLEVVDCTLPPSSYFEEEDFARGYEMIAWNEVNDAFAEPVSVSDSVADYAPTQIVAEVFRRAGYHGVMYRSGLDSHGVNAALFDTGYAKFMKASLHQVRSVEFVFEERSTPIFRRLPPSTE